MHPYSEELNVLNVSKCAVELQLTLNLQHLLHVRSCMAAKVPKTQISHTVMEAEGWSIC